MALRLKRASFLSTLKLYGSRGRVCYSKEVLHGAIRSQWRLHSSSSSEDDDFDELGPPVGENGRTHTKFITEKPEFFAAKHKFSASRKISTGMSSPAECIPTSNGLRISELFNSSRGKVKNGNGVPASKVNGNGVPASKVNGNGVPASKVKGNGVPASKVNGNGVPASKVNSNGVPASKVNSNGVPASKVNGNGVPASMVNGNGVPASMVKGNGVPVSKVNGIGVPESKIKGYGVPASKESTKKVTVRICNICQETAYHDIHLICSAHGPLESLVTNADDSVDAIFSMMDNSNVQKLVNRFNKTTLHNSQCSAEVVLADTNVKTNKKNLDEQGDKCSLRGQIAAGFDDFKRKFTTMKINTEDLEALHLALVELESHPEAISG